MLAAAAVGATLLMQVNGSRGKCKRSLALPYFSSWRLAPPQWRSKIVRSTTQRLKIQAAMGRPSKPWRGARPIAKGPTKSSKFVRRDPLLTMRSPLLCSQSASRCSWTKLALG